MKAVWATAALLCAPACYFGSGPNVAYPAPEVSWEKVPVSPPIGPPATTRSERHLLVSRFRSLVANPVGALYDHQVKNLSPLWRTYFARHTEVAVMEGFADRLREAGLQAWKDYTDSGNPALLEEPLRARRPVLISTTVEKLRHDQVRQTEPPGDFEALLLRVAIELRETDGALKANFARELLLKVPAGLSNVLQLAGAQLADALLADAGVRTALALAIDGPPTLAPAAPPPPALVPRAAGGAR